MLLLFAFALDPDRGVLGAGAPGLFWVAVLLASLLAVSRLQHRGRERRPRRAAPVGLDGGALPGQGGGIAVQLRCSRRCSPSAWCCCTTSSSARRAARARRPGRDCGVAAAGTLYGVLAAGLRVRETLVPVLLLPVVAPVLLGATRAWEAAIDGASVRRVAVGRAARGVRSAVQSIGMLAFGPLLEEHDTRVTAEC